MRTASQGVAIYQIGRPLDFLADSEEPRSSRGGGRRNHCEAALRLPVPRLDAPHPERELPKQRVKPTEMAFLLEEDVLLAAGNSHNEGGDAMSALGGVENRCYARFALNAPATVWRESSTIAGQVVNISLGGALLRLDPIVQLHEAVTVSVHDSARPVGPQNDLPATVVRMTEGGCAVRFDRTLLERGIGDAMPLFNVW